MTYLPYDPGVVPTKAGPTAGSTLRILVTGLPPYKDRSRSIRNRSHKAHGRFILLRNAAIEAMSGRAWHFGGVRLCLTIYAEAKELERPLVDYLGGVMDTLDGSSGAPFTFLPIIFEDDCQVWNAETRLVSAIEKKYEVDIGFD